VAVLSIITWCWARRLRPLHPLRARRYVDDLTVWFRGSPRWVAQAAAEAWGITDSFAAAWGLVVHADKSGLFATPGARAHLGGCAPGVRVLDRVNDLGLVHVFQGAAASSPAWQTRLADAAARCRRIGSLALPYAQRMRIVATSAVPAAVYGAVAILPPDADLRVLRTAAGRAVWRGGRFAAIELRLLLGGHDCRSDPYAAFYLAPLFMLAKALRYGAVTPAEAAATQQRGSGPLVRAVRRAMHKLLLTGSWLDWTASTPAHGDEATWQPFTRPLADTLSWLRRRWLLVAAHQVSRRRPLLGPLRDGIDWDLARLTVDSMGSEDRRAALRTIMVGDVVTARRARHFSRHEHP
jgi:hypothetical protein